MGIGLLRLKFQYGDLICWLGGEYTNQHRDWSATFEQMSAVRDLSILPLPSRQFARAERVCLEGIPLAAVHYCSMDALFAQNYYDNHPPLANVLDQVRAKLSMKEEENSFHLALPSFFILFHPRPPPLPTYLG